MTDSALAAGARGGGVTLGGQALKIVLQFVSVVVLSRLLTPDDFGLIAMVAVFIALGELIRDFGTSIVGLQRPNLSPQQASNLFWTSGALGSAALLGLVGATPLLVALYDEPRLAEIIPTLALSILLNALSAQFQVQLARGMKYLRLIVADVGAMAAGLGLGIAGAILGWGYWALVAQAVGTAASGLAFRWIASGWRPLRPRRDPHNRAMLKDSGAFGLAQFLTYLSQNLDTFVIGAQWDAASVGAYSRGYQLLTMPLNSMMGPLTQVVVPTINRAVRSGGTPDAVLIRVQFALGLGITWIYAVTAGTAAWLIPTLLGTQWESVVPLFQILALGGVVWAFSRVSYWRFVSDGLGKALLSYNVVTKSLSSGLIVAASFISIEAVAWAVSLGLIISWPINLVWLARTAGQDSWAYWWNGVGLVVAGGVSFTCAWALLSLLGGAGGFAAAVAGGSAAYVAVLLALPTSRRNTLATLRALRQFVAARGGQL